MVYTYFGNELYHHGILGMKWGVRRYQNEDGTLTEEGKKRYNRDIQENKAKKKDSRIDTSSPDPNRWVREDKERALDTVNESSKLVNQLSKIEQETRTQPVKQKMDLSNMTDKELRDQINRELLEQQYNKLFAEETTPQTSKGREYVQNTLEIAGTVLGLTSSALAIALSIQKLTGKG
ncbi:MAG: hypothetical protein LUE29_09750 [Lachnospiraceae bacterium]|nr:hypothetical protein [Lachnospiraceae bacterium]